jgi:hypothetical protein
MSHTSNNISSVLDFRIKKLSWTSDMGRIVANYCMEAVWTIAVNGSTD